MVQQVFNLIEIGELDELKKLTKTIPPASLINMRMAGSQTVLIYSVDKEKRDIMRWLIEEKHADVN